ncbi:MAG: hypothetical protein C0617_03885 [Desulfuromonas sp.]|uniref:Pycsar system effector family protein n=1 Tax=Desulfuromonas sp. TaxID=892 RepID=UPI000CB37FC6|nr:Pycsar system effector family protein [Desulfuromonas sp.]PLX85446.1 MAG: hypothetical protein C0617_03885 [Desulfuromonas sp.]
MTNPTPAEEPLIPRLLASNALRANLSKHMTLNQMADTKASMIITAASLVITITLTQFDKLGLATVLLLLVAGILAVIFSILAILPPLHAKGQINLFYYRSFDQLSEEEFKSRFKEAIADRDKLYDAYLHEIYYLGKHRLARKYGLIRNGLWTLLAGLSGAVLATLWLHLG